MRQYFAELEADQASDSDFFVSDYESVFCDSPIHFGPINFSSGIVTAEGVFDMDGFLITDDLPSLHSEEDPDDWWKNGNQQDR
jgi:hypothetical protein